MLEGDDTRSVAFALFLRPHTPGHLDSLCVPTPGNLPLFLKKNANAQGLARGGGGGMGNTGIDRCIKKQKPEHRALSYRVMSLKTRALIATVTYNTILCFHYDNSFPLQDWEWWWK